MTYGGVSSKGLAWIVLGYALKLVGTSVHGRATLNDSDGLGGRSHGPHLWSWS